MQVVRLVKQGEAGGSRFKMFFKTAVKPLSEPLVEICSRDRDISKEIRNSQ